MNKGWAVGEGEGGGGRGGEMGGGGGEGKGRDYRADPVCTISLGGRVRFAQLQFRTARQSSFTSGRLRRLGREESRQRERESE